MGQARTSGYKGVGGTCRDSAWALAEGDESSRNHMSKAILYLDGVPMVSRTFFFASLVHILKGPLTTDVLFPPFLLYTDGCRHWCFSWLSFLFIPSRFLHFVPRITLPEISLSSCPSLLPTRNPPSSSLTDD